MTRPDGNLFVPFYSKMNLIIFLKRKALSLRQKLIAFMQFTLQTHRILSMQRLNIYLRSHD